MVIGPRVHDVVVEGNTFLRNGRRGLNIVDDPTVSGIEVRANRVVQSEADSSAVCRADCTWYPVAHVAIGRRTADVAITRNRDGPGGPVVIGGADVAASADRPVLAVGS